MTSSETSILSKLQSLASSYHFPSDWQETRPYLLSEATVTLSQSHMREMEQLIAAVESVVQLPTYRERVFSWAPKIACTDPGVPGVFFGYDFHLTPEGPKLIEINSNAGGAALAELLAETHASTSRADWQAKLAHIFQAEWQLKRGQQPLSCVAIVDEDPATQFLYPDFLLFQAALQAHGIHTLVVDPSELSLEKGKLLHHKTPINLVYNRLTDFSLSLPENRVLREAYETDAIVLTPHPQSHALYADKRNLIALSDEELLKSWGVDPSHVQTLIKSIPRVNHVNAMDAEKLWAMRRELFFKPVAGYGGKGTYRGAKMSRGVFEEILSHPYVAQMLTPASEQQVDVGGETKLFKVDVRVYVCQGRVVGKVARLYQGQVTNMRTAGGGFARVVVG